MKKHIRNIALASLSILITTAIVVGFASAHETSSYKKRFPPEGHMNMMENHNEIRTAIENGDFEQFKSLVKDNNKMANNITKEKFPILVKMHSLMRDGKYQDAHELMKELGLDKGMMKHHGQHNHHNEE